MGRLWRQLGCDLSLIYAQTHPEAVRHLVLRGVFLMTQASLIGSMAAALGSSGPKFGHGSLHWSRRMSETT